MDQSFPSVIAQEHRDKVYKELARVMVDSLDTGEITVEQSEDISQFVLDHLDTIQTQIELDSFLKDLASQWPIYHSISTQLQDESSSGEKIKGIQEDLSQLRNQ